MSLAARHLEANGIPTVLFGCARDIVEHCAVPRFVFSDFPLGNPTGKPYDLDMQRAVLSLGLDLLVSASAPGTTVVTPYEWSADHSWKDKVFSKAQPFLDPEATRTWLERKETVSCPEGDGNDLETGCRPPSWRAQIGPAFFQPFSTGVFGRCGRRRSCRASRT